MLNKISALGPCQAQIDRFHKTSVISQVLAENLLGEFVGLQSSLGCNFG